MKHIIFLSALLILFISCVRTFEEKRNEPYSFFVAGHTYGKPLATNLGLHPPFKAVFPLIKAHPGIKFGVLTGDLVRYATLESWDSVKLDLNELEIPIYVAPGNHDITELNYFETFFGDTSNNQCTYRQFKMNNDLFFILDGNLDKWNIKGEQLKFLKEKLDFQSKQVNNIFVFIHQLIWWDDKNEFRNVRLNWPPITPDSTNYWSDIEPLLRMTQKPVYIFAGDLGANENATPFIYHEINKITYVAGGMGNMVNDNIVFVNVDEMGKVSLDLIALQGDHHRLGKLTDTKLP